MNIIKSLKKTPEGVDPFEEVKASYVGLAQTLLDVKLGHGLGPHTFNSDAKWIVFGSRDTTLA